MSHEATIVSPVTRESSVIVPVARCPVTTCVATVKDIPFIDQLQKMHGHMVGWMPTKQVEGKIAAGHVVVAWAPLPRSGPPHPNPLPEGEGERLGYCIAQDSYAGRDDVGIVYQLNVLPLKQRHLIGATLIKTVFERAAYGCRLFSCWCAQDIQANFFWQACGFVPLAFRTGSRLKQRIHIFWQRRTRADDAGQGGTPYWFPSLTKSGAVREDRLVLPIPPGTHWRDCKPVVLPGIEVKPEMPKTLPGGAPVRPRPEEPKVSQARRIAVIRSESNRLKGVPRGKAAVITSGGMRYIDRGDYVPEAEPAKPKREAKPRQVNDPKHVAAARELRDRYLEEINSGRVLPQAQTKYDVSRQLAGPSTPTTVATTPLLEAA
jgi:hypothetical protein